MPSAEPAIDPQRPIIDAHLHFWHIAEDERVAREQQRFLFDEALAEIDGCGTPSRIACSRGMRSSASRQDSLNARRMRCFAGQQQAPTGLTDETGALPQVKIILGDVAKPQFRQSGVKVANGLRLEAVLLTSLTTSRNIITKPGYNRPLTLHCSTDFCGFCGPVCLSISHEVPIWGASGCAVLSG